VWRQCHRLEPAEMLTIRLRVCERLRCVGDAQVRKAKLVVPDSDSEGDGADSGSEFDAESESASDGGDVSMDEEQVENDVEGGEDDVLPLPHKPKAKAAAKPAAPTKAAPTKAAPTKAAPTKAAPTKALPSAPPVTMAAMAAGGEAAALTGDAAARFANRDEQMYPFLMMANRRDGHGHRPDHPHYDAATLALPKLFPNYVLGNGEKKKLSEGQAQWWQFKAKHMDAVVLFKMGKFYELFEMDAHVGVDHLGLQYMSGDQPHAGFPEKGYAANAERLVRRGFRVVVVEQTETPEMLAERKRKDKSVKDKVVRREAVAVLTRGTLTDTDMLAAQPDASMLLAVWEEPTDSTAAEAIPEERLVGLCALDAATGVFRLGQFMDDGLRSKLRAVLAQLRPVELVVPTAPRLSAATTRALREGARGATALTKTLAHGDTPGGFWGTAHTLAQLRQHVAGADHQVCASERVPRVTAGGDPRSHPAMPRGSSSGCVGTPLTRGASAVDRRQRRRSYPRHWWRWRRRAPVGVLHWRRWEGA
jgi:DNA mismatch repair protein MSH6